MKLVQQLDTNDCGMACALMILHHFAKTGLSLTEFKVKHHYARNELSFYELEKLLTSYQLEVEGYYLETFGDLSGLVSPVLVDVKREGGINLCCCTHFRNQWFSPTCGDYVVTGYDFICGDGGVLFRIIRIIFSKGS